MRFSAPTREPPGGRPSRGAKLKGRGCTRQKDARNENRLGGTGAAKKAPSEQGATKAAGLGAEDARLEPRQRSLRSECHGTDEGSGGVAQGRQQKKAHDKGAQHFFLLPLVIPLRTPRQAQEAATQGTPISPSVFYWVGCAVGCVVIYVFSFFTLCVLTCYRAYDGLRLRIESAMRGWMDGFQVRCSFMIAVEAAAGAVFLPIIKLRSWVRRDGLSLDFQRSRGFPNSMWPHWASVSAEQGPKEK